MPKFITAAALVFVCVAPGGTALSGATPNDIYQAIRSDDLARLTALIATPADANAKDDAGETPLMSAAAAGSIDAMRLLIDKGADVNAQNVFGSTALIWSVTDAAKVRLLLDRGADVTIATKTGRTAAFVAAMSDSSAAIVRLLVDKGASLKGKDAFQNTMLTAAAMGNDIDTIRMAVDAGVDVNAAGVTGMTPLHVSAYHANVAAMTLLLSKGAKVNAVATGPTLFPLDFPKSGPISLSAMTPLLAAVAAGSVDGARALLDAGANINAKDGRNMTPLMVAVATNHQNPALIRLLVDRGADAAVQSGAGETAMDWARKLGAPDGLTILKVAKPPEMVRSETGTRAIDVKTAAERSMALLEASSRKFYETSGCVSCHHQNITDLAAGEARAKGLRVNAADAADRLKMLASFPPAPVLLERMDIAVPEILASTLTALASAGYAPDRVTDKLVANIAATQASDGSWHVVNGLGDRPPAEEAAITRTALCIRSLKAFGTPGRAAEMRRRIDNAQRWLLSAKPMTSEDRNMRLLGLFWAGADARMLKPFADTILAEQQRDGGWRQHGGVPTDAYATGQSLYALAKTGCVSPSDAIYTRGVSFLLTTQAESGAWRVASRSPKFQAYFNSGFPYAGDQWISAWATGWATMALAQAVP